MGSTIIYARSATDSPRRLRIQRKLCRSYLREIGLTETDFVAEHSHTESDLTALIEAAARSGITEVIISDLSRLRPDQDTIEQNLDTLEEAGLTVHVAAGTLSGPVSDDHRSGMFLFAASDARALHGDETAEG